MLFSRQIINTPIPSNASFKYLYEYEYAYNNIVSNILNNIFRRFINN